MLRIIYTTQESKMQVDTPGRETRPLRRKQGMAGRETRPLRRKWGMAGQGTRPLRLSAHVSNQVLKFRLSRNEIAKRAGVQFSLIRRN